MIIFYWALGALVAGIFFWAVFIGERCKKCKTRLDLIEVKDPFGRARRVFMDTPRVGTLTYRCSQCGAEETRRSLITGRTHDEIQK